MSAEEFVTLARRVVEAKGEPRHGGLFDQDSLIYEDDRIVIRVNFNGLDLEVERKKIPGATCDSLRTVSNPTTMVWQGEIIRHHGEAYAIEGHLRGLAEGLE